MYTKGSGIKAKARQTQSQVAAHKTDHEGAEVKILVQDKRYQLASMAARSAVNAVMALALVPAMVLAAEPAAKSELLAAIATYTPGTAVTPELDERIKALAAKLEASTGGKPDLAAKPGLVAGIWTCVFDSRDLLHVAGMKIMSGGRYADAKIPARATIQELVPERGFYRNTVVLAAGPDAVAVNYEATAELMIEPTAPNIFRVKFTQLAFVPADAKHDAAAVRAALGLPADAPLVLQVPPGPASPSEVTYVDADLRINRGKAYVSILRRLQ